MFFFKDVVMSLKSIIVKVVRQSRLSQFRLFSVATISRDVLCKYQMKKYKRSGVHHCHNKLLTKATDMTFFFFLFLKI